MTEIVIHVPVAQKGAPAPVVSSRRTIAMCGVMRQSRRDATELRGFTPHFDGGDERSPNAPRAKGSEMPLKGGEQCGRTLARLHLPRRFLKRVARDLKRVPRIRGGEGA